MSQHLNKMNPKTLLFFLFYCVVLSRAQWEHFENLGERINTRVQKKLAPLHDLGPRMLNRVKDQLFSSDHLGEKIEQQVYEGLKPVRVMLSIISTKQGSGGTTIATFNTTGKQLIIRDGQYFECNGTISVANGSCSGNLENFEFSKNEDFCYTTLHTSHINDWVCIQTSPSGRSGFVDGDIVCESYDNSPTLLITNRDYKKLCDDVVSAQYKYFTNNPLVDVGNGLKCEGSNPQICNFSETFDRNSRSFISNGRSVIIDY